MIQFFNTFSGKLEEFKPIDPKGKEAKIYTCGPTVYDYAHIGNFRAFIFEDLLRRFLEYKGYKVTHVMNITDVDDKTIAGANQNVGAGPCARPRNDGQPQGVAPTRELTVELLNQYTEKYIQAFNEDLKTLNILPPTKQPRATAEIPSMISLIEKLIKHVAAYVSDGSVYYRVASFPNYGKLSKKDLKGNIKGARVDVDEYEKEEGADFALWKKAKEGEPSWDSPWGKGRPGWHIECSAMSMKYLGETFDIHAGGEDLIFPHHENEIAQSEGATGKPFVKYWLHAKHLLVNGEKMSKSKGNFYTLRDLFAKYDPVEATKYDPMALRLALLNANYRKSLNFTFSGLRSAKINLEYIISFYESIKNHESLGRKFRKEDVLINRINELRLRIDQALSDDLNISEALAAFFTFTGDAETKIKGSAISKQDREELLKFLDSFVKSLLGLKIDKPIPDRIKEKVELRDQLRKEKKFEEADRVRKEVESEGFKLWDEPTGTGITPL